MPATRTTRQEIDFEVLPPEGQTKERPTGSLPQDPLFALVARLMDNFFRIPGTQIRFGLDPLIGLIPGLGDSSSAVVSALLILRGAQAGVSKVVLLRMAANVLINAGVGAVPVVGDVFSVWFQSNRLNYALYQRHAGQPGQARRSDWLFVGALLAVLLLLVGGLIFLGITLFAALWRTAWGA